MVPCSAEPDRFSENTFGVVSLQSPFRGERLSDGLTGSQMEASRLEGFPKLVAWKGSKRPRQLITFAITMTFQWNPLVILKALSSYMRLQDPLGTTTTLGGSLESTPDSSTGGLIGGLSLKERSGLL